MHPIHHAKTTPGKAAIIMAGSGETVTYGQLDERANQGAHLFRSLGLKRGDAVAIFMDNNARYMEAVLASERSGLYVTCISSKLTAGEVEYIVKDCEAKVFIASRGVAAVAAEVVPLIPGVALYMCDGAQPPFQSFEDARAAFPTTPIADPSPGMTMLYSSGTTGRPKGVRRPLPEGGVGETPGPLMMLHVGLYGASPDSVYLSPAPMYHAAPLGWSMGMLQLGGTVVVMEKFDPEAALKYIEQYKATTAQWVPTHFVKMLKLPEEVRSRYDLSSLKAVFHAAAPCPIPVKEQMIGWWGPIIHEYYAGTEGNGFTAINSEEWLAHKGSVGKGLTAEVKICDENGEPLPPRAEGGVYFSGGGAFEYYKDPKKTAEAANQHGWTTLGDVGWLDEEGFLYLTDRKSFMIISGGVNIYPQEIENLLIGHPKVADVAVIGAPDDEMGEKVVAIIQPADWSQAGPDLAAELMAYARANLSHVKAPRRVDFMEELPRHATGKLYKRLIRDAYWGKGDGSMVITPGA
ncbi:long-chain acyl-CoA synthetase [Caulobacter ginsengisoli]|uniref:Long-chain acyl-CoA synthetase n=1 Tax=Caulobacter ginsengisoli TaxID=400775 RepID=A0ABU0IPZ3_9CAUL|nr:acyl-CoA synthetase [Caulobacter ginsengisoli]MDQ0463485.1 long-chain acyl-CoA synthetase [Caulobacter ginsengisoli]